MTEENRSFLIQFIKDLRTFENIERKKLLFPIMEKVRKKSFYSKKIYSSMGEDAASFFFNDQEEDLILLTTDAITEEFSKKNPWAAGFSAIMVGADDIYACGGVPIAASAVISSNVAEIREKLLDGLLEATHRFEIPLIRGHTSDKTSNTSVSVSIVGKIKKKNYISAGNAQEGDIIAVIADFNGQVGKTSKYYWDTVTFKSKEEILKKRAVMLKFAKKKLLHSSKDVSNGGILGTLLLLLQYSKKGAVVNIESIETPSGILTQEFGLVDYLKMYMTSAFLVTLPETNFSQIKKIGTENGLAVFKIGNITANAYIQLQYKNCIEVFLDITNYL